MESEDMFSESNEIKENGKHDKGTAKPVLTRTRRRMSSLVEPKHFQ